MAGIRNVPGADTQVETFQPFRASPVFRRVCRKYHFEEGVVNTSEFRQLSVNIHNPDERLVINEARLVLPLELTASRIKLDGSVETLDLRASTGRPACNIAQASNPFRAFKSIHTVINGKVYSELPREYGHVLDKCWRSTGENQFPSDNSLVPYVNTNDMDFAEEKYQVMTPQQIDQIPGDDSDRYVVLRHGYMSQDAANLTHVNSGFLERARTFQNQVIDDGQKWKGIVSAPLNTALWSSEARGQSNGAIPYVEDLFLRFVFASQGGQFDSKWLKSIAQAEPYSRVVAQGLFEFLTPFNRRTDQDPGAYKAMGSWPQFYQMRWTAQPYIQIEWVEYQEMLPLYRLRGFRYQHVKSNTIDLPLLETTTLEEARDITANAHVTQECLAVPNAIYIWADMTEESARNAYFTGGTFRPCDIRDIVIRVNENAHIIDHPDAQSMLYKWFKRNTNSPHEFSTWDKQKVIVLTPTEFGLNQWLENDAMLSTLDISCKIGVSRYQWAMLPHLQKPTQATLSGYNSGGLVFRGEKKLITSDDVVLQNPQAASYLTTSNLEFYLGNSDHLGIITQAYNQHSPFFALMLSLRPSHFTNSQYLDTCVWKCDLDLYEEVLEDSIVKLHSEEKIKFTGVNASYNFALAPYISFQNYFWCIVDASSDYRIVHWRCMKRDQMTGAQKAMWGDRDINIQFWKYARSFYFQLGKDGESKVKMVPWDNVVPSGDGDGLYKFDFPGQDINTVMPAFCWEAEQHQTVTGGQGVFRWNRADGASVPWNRTKRQARPGRSEHAIPLIPWDGDPPGVDIGSGPGFNVGLQANHQDAINAFGSGSITGGDGKDYKWVMIAPPKTDETSYTDKNDPKYLFTHGPQHKALEASKGFSTYTPREYQCAHLAMDADRDLDSTGKNEVFTRIKDFNTNGPGAYGGQVDMLGQIPTQIFTGPQGEDNNRFAFESVASEDASKLEDLKYELNVLLEYSNSQILMSRTRDIPIHVSNNVPQ